MNSTICFISQYDTTMCLIFLSYMIEFHLKSKVPHIRNQAYNFIPYIKSIRQNVNEKIFYNNIYFFYHSSCIIIISFVFHNHHKEQSDKVLNLEPNYNYQLNKRITNDLWLSLSIRKIHYSIRRNL